MSPQFRKKFHRLTSRSTNFITYLHTLTFDINYLQLRYSEVARSKARNWWTWFRFRPRLKLLINSSVSNREINWVFLQKSLSKDFLTTFRWTYFGNCNLYLTANLMSLSVEIISSRLMKFLFRFKITLLPDCEGHFCL